MMKAKFLAVLALLLPLLANAADYKEGEHYSVVSQVATSTPEVREFFSVLCPHCYSFEPTVAKLKEALGKEIRIERNHVDFVGRDIGPHYSRAYAIIVALGKEAELLPQLFKMAQVEHRYFSKEADVRAFFLANGVDAKTFDGVVNSFAVEGMVAQMRQATVDKKIQGVPAFVVNGKYLINNKNVRSYEDLKGLIDYLISKK